MAVTLTVLLVTLGCIGFFIELKQLEADCASLGYGGYMERDGKRQFYLFDDPTRPTTKADRRPSEARPCGELAGRKVKMASQ
ncbi:hypothetical protein [Gimesia fumaroli]|uniref:hypothetical protein n=1 Tax=Gimesia fumaroli TaxID=2527976 RepID=UPI0011A40AAA|nr:hypothetical protein [Gimesia fumaroli]